MSSVMSWLSLPFRLRARGVLGMNARNAEFILEHNPRALFPIVDDKLRFREMCERLGVPTPTVFAIFERQGDLRHLAETLVAAPDCVIKPARGSSGRGVLLLTGRDAGGWRMHNDTIASLDELRRHVSDILSGLFSLGGRPDRAVVQQRLRPHPSIERLSVRGTPDIRVLIYRGEPALAMLRLPTRASGGRANLHQGGVGVGVNVQSGLTTLAVCRGRAVACHPDTDEPLNGRSVPDWPAVLTIAQRVARATGLGYVGVDVVPTTQGPMVLEANARPGLAIQAANAVGLRSVLERIDESIRQMRG
jgi:alpha-L-glutamate ligase-like protein